MTPWLVALACLLGAGFVAWGAGRLRLRWPLATLSVLLAVIAVQLFVAALGQNGMRSMAAVVAQFLTVVPALIGVAAGLALARIQGQRPALNGTAGVLTLAALAIAAGGVILTLLL